MTSSGNCVNAVYADPSVKGNKTNSYEGDFMVCADPLRISGTVLISLQSILSDLTIHQYVKTVLSAPAVVLRLVWSNVFE